MRAKRRMVALLAAGVTAALAGSGAVGATSAMACTGTAIAGQGSSLQKIAQETWITGSGKCVTYTASGSGAGLKAFGVGKVETPASSKDVFVGTDDAPTAAQLTEIDKAANGAGEKGQALVIPVAQAAIAVIANPPTGCTITKIGNEDLEKVFRAAITNWREIATASPRGAGEACDHSIVRVVREDASGTTYQFKHYLFEINKSAVRNGTETWAELQPEPTPNLEWPEEATVVRPAAKGGAEEVAKVVSTSNSIGYANLGDAEAGGAKWLKVQNNTGGSEAKYVEPVTGTKEANCGAVEYTAPAKATEADADWSGVYGGNPSIGLTHSTTYSICTLTWDVALVSAETAGLTKAEGGVSKEYIERDVSATGQGEINKNKGYGTLTAGIQADAEALAKLIK